MNGFFNINKEFGISSAKAVWLVKKKFNLKEKIGHMGTLDPNATGVLIVGIGRANRLFNIMQNKRKTYVATFEFGYETETLDLESEVKTKTSKVIPNLNELKLAVLTMIGKQNQVAPHFSAKNINGRRAYELAREGKVAELKPHQIEVFKFECLKQNNLTSFDFEIECSSGTYIRSLCRDLAYKLNSVATMTALKRTKCGPFDITNSKKIEDLTDEDLLHCDLALDFLPTLNLSEEQIKKIKNGVKQQCDYADGNYKIYDKNGLVGVAKVENKVASIPTWLV